MSYQVRVIKQLRPVLSCPVLSCPLVSCHVTLCRPYARPFVLWFRTCLPILYHPPPLFFSSSLFSSPLSSPLPSTSFLDTSTYSLYHNTSFFSIILFLFLLLPSFTPLHSVLSSSSLTSCDFYFSPPPPPSPFFFYFSFSLKSHNSVLL